MATQRAPGQRAGLTLDSIRQAALDLLTSGGVEGLTMRALGTRLGVAPNAVYSHVTDKNELIDQILDDLLAAVESRPDDDPIRGLKAVMSSTYTVLTEHPNIVPLYIKRRGARGSNAMRLGEAMLEMLETAGLDPDETVRARHVLIVYTIGAAAYATTAPLASSAATPPDALDATTQTFLAGLEWLLNGIQQSG